MDAINPAAPAPRPSRVRPTSYYNHFQTTCAASRDDPPTYLAATRHVRPSQPSPPAPERLPSYQCTLHVESKMLMCVESVSPLNPAVDAEWREVFVAVHGTMLNIYRIKDDQAGKLIRSYTLQHAEVGLATDTRHSVLVPRTRFASLLPTAARRRAWAKDPSLFEVVRQTALRVRVETDQLLLADASEERIHAIITAISAGLDIALPIDERSIPRQCTMPRRQNRRPRPQRSADFAAADLADPDLLAEQARILRTMYPALADSSSVTSAASQTGEDALLAPVASRDEPTPATPTREEDEPDLSLISEDSSASAVDETATPSDSAPEYTPSASSRDSTSSSETDDNAHFSADMMYATAAANFNDSGKWAPAHPRSVSQTMRYVRRCMPVLLVDAPRASDILCTAAGKRVKINWRMELLEEWELTPPSYKSHMFAPRDNPVFAAANAPAAVLPPTTSLTRTVSHISSAASASATDDDDQHSDTFDLITPAAQLATILPTDTTTTTSPPATPTPTSGIFSLGKFRSKRSTSSASTTTVPAKEARDAPLLSRHELSGLAYCF